MKDADICRLLSRESLTTADSDDEGNAEGHDWVWLQNCESGGAARDAVVIEGQRLSITELNALLARLEGCEMEVVMRRAVAGFTKKPARALERLRVPVRTAVALVAARAADAGAPGWLAPAHAALRASHPFACDLRAISPHFYALSLLALLLLPRARWPAQDAAAALFALRRTRADLITRYHDRLTPQHLARFTDQEISLYQQIKLKCDQI